MERGNHGKPKGGTEKVEEEGRKGGPRDIIHNVAKQILKGEFKHTLPKDSAACISNKFLLEVVLNFVRRTFKFVIGVSVELF